VILTFLTLLQVARAGDGAAAPKPHTAEVAAEADAGPLAWVLAYRSTPGWAALGPRAAAGPVEDGAAALPEITKVCTDEKTPIAPRYGACVTRWKALTDKNVADWRLNFLLARTADAAGDHAVAYVAGTMAVQLNQKDPLVAYILVDFALQAGQPADAVAAASHAMGLKMDELTVADTALAVAQMKALPMGLQLLDDAIRLKPTSGVLLTRRGLLLTGGGRPDLALPVLERARATGYAGADLHITLGHTFMGLQRPEDALKAYRDAVKLNPAAKVDVPAELQGRL
jgi:tetratricopeptide (TPR) repeat protein